ncbi:MAG: formate hydrogenase, partial [Leptospiraceae bacterium]|nr:formate hydrogenase [Leptospiraceae bacterium]
MNVEFLSIVAILIFLNILINILTAFTKSKARVSRWSLLVVLFSVSLILSWHTKDFATQWVLIEACTLFGALLISMSDNDKAISVA